MNPSRPVILSLSAGLILAALAAGCGSSSPDPAEPPRAPTPGSFDHQQHDTLRCEECHALSSVLSGAPARPGASDHSPCDRAKCHRAEFMRAPGALCRLCHESVDVTSEDGTTLVVYPPSTGPRALPSLFSHKSHLDRGAMERAVGFHVSCTDCHSAADSSALRQPDHSTCARCHAPESGVGDAPRLTDCTRCHFPLVAPPPRHRALIVGDLRFSHASHRLDRGGRLITCATCHAQTAETDHIGAHVAPTARTCVDCHDDTDRTPSSRRMQVCETCHSAQTSTLGVLAPRSHLPATEIPADHTLAFRRDHGDDAEARATECSRCHSFLSGNPRDTCDECHQVLRPRSHVVTWREFDHGPEAATSSDACSTCHRADFCIACHSQVPRSHFPRSEFRERGHGTQAVIDYRACMACHDPPRDCASSGCHVLGSGI